VSKCSWPPHGNGAGHAHLLSLDVQHPQEFVARHRLQWSPKVNRGAFWFNPLPSQPLRRQTPCQNSASVLVAVRGITTMKVNWEAPSHVTTITNSLTMRQPKHHTKQKNSFDPPRATHLIMQLHCSRYARCRHAGGHHYPCTSTMHPATPPSRSQVIISSLFPHSLIGHQMLPTTTPS